jgi:hypothetical protein
MTASPFGCGSFHIRKVTSTSTGCVLLERTEVVFKPSR